MKTRQNPLIKETLAFFTHPLEIYRNYDKGNLRPDLIAGATVAVVMLPQAIAYALIAELPPQMGLYTGIIAAIIGGLWGSSFHLNTGPTNAISLLVFSTLIASAESGSAEFIMMAGLLGIMVGLFQLILGISRMGLLVNFVSHSVVVGFASGAGVLIAIKQLRPLFGLEVEGHTTLESLSNVIINLRDTHLPTFALGFGTILLILLLKRTMPKVPGPLAGMVIAALFVGILGLDSQGVSVLGELPRSLPPFANISFNMEAVAELSTGAFAVAAVALVEAVSISRSLATETGQHLDSNQEFVGQGLANIFAGLFSGYPGSGSFARSAINLKSGAKTSFSSVFSGLFVLFAMIALGPLAVYVPRTALAGVLIVTAYSMINKAEIARILRGSREDAIIVSVTFFGTLFLELEFAVLAGILISFAVYILKTSVPRVVPVLPDENFRHFTHQPGRPYCPQLGIMELYGDLYFGAVSHVEKAVRKHLDENPTQRYLMFRMHSVVQCDYSGIHALESIVRSVRERGGDVFFVRVQPPVYEVMESTGFIKHIGKNHFLYEDQAISQIFYKTLDPAICIYECEVRVFKECQNLPKRLTQVEIPPFLEAITGEVENISAKKLWSDLKGEKPPHVIDVREPREFQQGHIPQAALIPLPQLISASPDLPKDRLVILVCRSGRRSHQAARHLKSRGVVNVKILEGGILSWENELLLQAVDQETKGKET